MVMPLAAAHESYRSSDIITVFDTSSALRHPRGYGPCTRAEGWMPNEPKNRDHVFTTSLAVGGNAQNDDRSTAVLHRMDPRKRPPPVAVRNDPLRYASLCGTPEDSLPQRVA